MKAGATSVGKALAVPAALAFAFHSTDIVHELLADEYTEPPTPAVEDPGHMVAESLHREKIFTRTVNCIEGCGRSVFASLSGLEQKAGREDSSVEPRRRSKDQTLTAGVDWVHGDHLVGFALGASNGDASTYSSESRAFDIDRDKQSVGLYYGLALPFNFNLTAQVLLSDYQYESVFDLPDPDSGRDFAEYDGSGYSTSLGAVAVIPLIADDFEYFVEPSIHYLYVKTDVDAYQSQAGEDFDPIEQVSEEWLLSLRWRKGFNPGSTFLFPFGGFTYRMIDREIKRKEGDQHRDQNFFEGMLGLTMQRRNFNLSASYRKSIDADNYDREHYQLTLKVRF